VLTTAGAVFLVLSAISVATGDGERSRGIAPEAPDKPAAGETPDAFGDGKYVIGENMPPGTYTTAGTRSEGFAFCTVTTEPTGDSVLPQLRSAEPGEPVTITLTGDDGVVTVQGCQPLTLRQ
jgi:hypothetical protein